MLPYQKTLASWLLSETEWEGLPTTALMGVGLYSEEADLQQALGDPRPCRSGLWEFCLHLHPFPSALCPPLCLLCPPSLSLTSIFLNCLSLPLNHASSPDLHPSVSKLINCFCCWIKIAVAAARPAARCSPIRQRDDSTGLLGPKARWGRVEWS